MPKFEVTGRMGVRLPVGCVVTKLAKDLISRFGDRLEKLDKPVRYVVQAPVTLKHGTAFSTDDDSVDLVAKASAERLDKPKPAAASGATNPPVEPSGTETLIGSNVLPADVEIAEGKTVPLGAIVQAAHEYSDLTVDAWNDLPEADREARLAVAVDAAKAAEAETGGNA